jgi:hypothetical protein
MPEAQVLEWIRNKYVAIVPDLDERGRRRWAAAEARSLGWGGIAAVAQATGISDRTIRNGIGELDDPDPLAEVPKGAQSQRHRLSRPSYQTTQLSRRLELRNSPKSGSCTA